MDDNDGGTSCLSVLRFLAGWVEDHHDLDDEASMVKRLSNAVKHWISSVFHARCLIVCVYCTIPYDPTKNVLLGLEKGKIQLSLYPTARPLEDGEVGINFTKLIAKYTIF